jgi:hypothetical protein
MEDDVAYDDGSAGGGGSGSAADGTDSLFNLIPAKHHKDLIWCLLGNADMIVALLSMLEPVCKDRLSFSVQTARGPHGQLVSNLHINSLVLDGTMFVTAQLPCDIRFFNETKCGVEYVTVSLSKLMQPIKRKGGSANLAMWQVLPSVCTDLFAVTRDGSIVRDAKVTNQGVVPATDKQQLPRFDIEYRLTVAVEMLRNELGYANSVAKDDTKKVTLSVLSVNGGGSGSGAPDKLLLHISAVGLGGCTACSVIEVERAGDIDDDAEPVRHCFEQSKDPSPGSGAGYCLETAKVEYTDVFYGASLLKILLAMRGEAEVDILLASPGKPLTMRVQLGERPGAGQANTSFIAFVVAPAPAADA